MSFSGLSELLKDGPCQRVSNQDTGFYRVFGQIFSGVLTRCVVNILIGFITDSDGVNKGLSRICRQRADVLLSWMQYSRERAVVADYVDLVPVFHGDYDLYVSSGERDTLRLTADMVHSLLRPLHADVWLLLCEYRVVSSQLASVLCLLLLVT